MKLEKIEIAKAFLASQMDYWVLQAIAFTILILQGEASYNMWRWGLLSFYPFVLYLLRRKFTGFAPFTISHLTFAVILALIPVQSTMERTFFILYVAGYTIYSFYIRMNTQKWQDKAMPPLISGGVLAVLVFVLYYFKRSDLEIYFVVFCVVYLVIYFAYSYLLEYIHFVKVNEASAGYIPVKKMFKAGLKTVLPYSLASGILLLAIGNLSVLTDIFSFLKNVLLWLLRLLFSGGKENVEYVEEGIAEFTQPVNPTMPKIEGEALWIWEILEKVFAVGAVVLLVILVIKVYQIVSRVLKNKFGRSMQKNKEVKEELVDKREKCALEKERNVQPTKSVLSIFSNKERIRKIYKKKIESARKTSGFRNFLKEDKTEEACLKDSSTARECCENLSAQPLADVYEKARYSNMECGGEDVRLAKKWQ